MDCVSQLKHRVRLDWGWRGAREAARRGDAVVVVDVLRFATAAVVAASRGVLIYPAANEDEVTAAVSRFDAGVIENGLAPASYQTLRAGARVVLWSPNGATCVQLARPAPRVMVG